MLTKFYTFFDIAENWFKFHINFIKSILKSPTSAILDYTIINLPYLKLKIHIYHGSVQQYQEDAVQIKISMFLHFPMTKFYACSFLKYSHTFLYQLVFFFVLFWYECLVFWKFIQGLHFIVVLHSLRISKSLPKSWFTLVIVFKV
jgi:hypothetical protein